MSRPIDADKLKQYFIDKVKDFTYKTIHVDDVVAYIDAMPTVEPKRGEWVPFEYGDERWHKCTACGVADKYIEYVERPNGTTGKLVAIRNFCPNCGARMKGVNDE